MPFDSESSLDLTKFEQEYSHCSTGYMSPNSDVSREFGNGSLRALPGQKKLDLDKKVWGEFYKSIDKIYFYKTGSNDGGSWVFFGRFLTGHYVYIKAWCDYTGFDCQGGVLIHAINDLDLMIDKGLCEQVRKVLKL